MAELLSYDAVITWSNLNYQSGVNAGNVFADYVDRGGAVVVATFANGADFNNYYLAGRWITGGYEVIQGRGGYLITAASLGTILQPTHPVLAGVVSLEATSAFRPTQTLLTQGSVLAVWNDGSILAAAGDMPGRVDLGLFPPSDACQSAYWNSGGDGTLLVANALEFVVDRVKVGTPFCQPAIPNSTGLPTTIDAFVGPQGLHLDAQQGTPNQFGYFLLAPNFADPGVQISQGLFCLAPSATQGFVRYNITGSPWNSVGPSTRRAFFKTSPTPLRSGVDLTCPIRYRSSIRPYSPGTPGIFSFWHREPGGTSNFSNGLSVTF